MKREEEHKPGIHLKKTDWKTFENGRMPENLALATPRI